MAEGSWDSLSDSSILLQKLFRPTWSRFFKIRHDQGLLLSEPKSHLNSVVGKPFLFDCLICDLTSQSSATVIVGKLIPFYRTSNTPNVLEIITTQVNQNVLCINGLTWTTFPGQAQIF